MNTHAPRILLVELPTLLRDIVRYGVESEADAVVGEIDRQALDVFAGQPIDTTLIVAGNGDVFAAAQWRPQRRLLAPSPGFRVLRLDPDGQAGVLFEMRPVAQLLPDLGIDLLRHVVSHPGEY